MIEHALNPAPLREFKAHLRGDVISPDDCGYDASRKVWNGMITTYPALIVYCADQADVIRTIRFAQSQHLSVAVRGGGHSLAGSSVCDGGLLIDLSRMKGICIDHNRRTVQAQAGLTLGEFVRATQAFGLATTTGAVAGTGLAGLTLDRKSVV
jgi:FAD/FMN-containing dehydrogenase